jgi:calpain-7
LQKYRAQLPTARTKDEALTLAISAAENLMKALKLTSDPNEKKELKAQCGEAMDVAGRIKNDTKWKPSVEPPQARTRNERIDQWATEVVSAQSSTGLEDIVSQSSLSRHGLASTTAPVDDASAPSGKYSASSVSFGGWNEHAHHSRCTQQSVQTASELIIDIAEGPLLSSDLKSSLPTDAGNKGKPKHNLRDAPNAQVSPISPAAAVPSHSSFVQHPEQDATQNQTTPLGPSIAAYSHIHRLAEPVTTRRRSKREDIILLKASMVNGFKCPPWDKNPIPDEFVPHPEAELFT